MSNYDKTYDENIIVALKRLPIPLKTAKGNNVYFIENKRDETIYEHIANKKHHFHLSDIDLIPLILLDPNSLNKDSRSNKFHNYIGKRRRTNEREKYIKIITKVQMNKKEIIVTIYPTKKVNKFK